MHHHEIELTKENFASFFLKARALGKNYENAFLEQCTRQGLDISALNDKLLDMDKLFRVVKEEK